MTRKKLTQIYAKRYRKARSKKEKTMILDEFVNLTGYNRSYASWLLRHAGRKVRIQTPQGERVFVVADPHRKITRTRRRVYGEKVFRVLVKVWAILDYPCSLRLKAMLPKVIPKLEACGEFDLDEETRDRLLRISRATIDRLLSGPRRRMRLRARARTKPGTLLMREIPIRTGTEWEGVEPGYLEIDLVSHDGGLAKGDHAWSLVLTDIFTQWTEVIPVRNRAQVWTFEALKEATKRFPFRIRGIDSDNDSAFLNHHLYRWCKEKGIVFTRSRPYRKNDNCHVEQKNWSVARRYFGYWRYETERSLEVMRELGELLSLYINFFQPSVKLVEKVRVGARVRRKYDEPKTPYERVLEAGGISEETKEVLRRTYERLNPAELRRKILRLQRMLIRLATPVEGVTHE